jgi:hypothetical protein
LVKEMAENVWKMLAVRLRSAVSGISQHWVWGQAEFFSKKIVLLQKFVIQPKKYRRTCTHPVNERGLNLHILRNLTSSLKIYSGHNRGEDIFEAPADLDCIFLLKWNMRTSNQYWMSIFPISFSFNKTLYSPEHQSIQFLFRSHPLIW